MKTPNTIRGKQAESGIALLIAIFALLLVSVAAIAMILSSGTESALAGNYRSSTSAYFAASAGLEEARSRLLPTNPSTIWNNLTAIMTTVGTVTYLPTNQVLYITNPGPGEPAGAGLLALYPDNEYGREFPLPVPPTKTYVNSVWTGGATTGPRYKWVRINAATKNSLGADVDNTGTALAIPNASTPLYYDSGPIPASMIVPPAGFPATAPPSTAKQLYEVTALAVLPNGAGKVLQYVVAPVTYGLNFPGALNLGGTIGNFKGANSNPYHINGQDGSGSVAVPGCAPNPATVKAAINLGAGNAANGQTNQAYVDSQLPRPDHYTGAPQTPSVPPLPNDASVTTDSLTGSLSSPASMDQMLQQIQQNADAVIPNPPNAPGYNNSGTTYNFGGPGWPTDMSANNPQVVYVDGSFDLGPNTGYGILVVTGNFTYHGNSGWNGIILVVGDGTTTYLGNGGGNGEFDGAIFAATTRDPSGNQLPNYGTVNFDINGGGGNGIYYSSCWINKVQRPPKYRILSFREF